MKESKWKTVLKLLHIWAQKTWIELHLIDKGEAIGEEGKENEEDNISDQQGTSSIQI